MFSGSGIGVGRSGIGKFARDSAAVTLHFVFAQGQVAELTFQGHLSHTCQQYILPWAHLPLSLFDMLKTRSPRSSQSSDASGRLPRTNVYGRNPIRKSMTHKALRACQSFHDRGALS